jgi:hypothetical protein
MITIDLQDDEVTQTKNASRLGKDKTRRDGGRRLDLVSTTGENLGNRPTKPGLIARLLKVIFKEI